MIQKKKKNFRNVALFTEKHQTYFQITKFLLVIVAI